LSKKKTTTTTTTAKRPLNIFLEETVMQSGRIDIKPNVKENLFLTYYNKTIFYDRTPTNYLLVNLALADIIVALFIAPQFILIHTFKHPGGMIGTVLCKLLTGGTFMWLGATASAFTLVVIAFERYYAVLQPHSIKGKMTNSKLKVSAAVIRKRQNHHLIYKDEGMDYVLCLLN